MKRSGVTTGPKEEQLQMVRGALMHLHASSVATSSPVPGSPMTSF